MQIPPDEVQVNQSALKKAVSKIENDKAIKEEDETNLNEAVIKQGEEGINKVVLENNNAGKVVVKENNGAEKSIEKEANIDMAQSDTNKGAESEFAELSPPWPLPARSDDPHLYRLPGEDVEMPITPDVLNKASVCHKFYYRFMLWISF